MVTSAEEIRRFVGVGPPARNLDRVLAAVLFTDIVGSTERLSELGDAGWRSVLASVTTSVLARRSNVTGAATSIPQATGSSRPSMAQPCGHVCSGDRRIGP